jgi:hypothetical protein
VLSRLGWAAALTRDGVERTDILAANPEGRHIAVQVKTTQEWKNPKFMFGEKGCEPSRSPQEWFVLVALGQGDWDAPRAFVVPRDHASAGVWIRHVEWLTNPSVKSGKRTSSLRHNRIDAWLFERYEQRWDLLGNDTDKIAVLLPPRCRTLAREHRVGLPKDHPWRSVVPEWDTTESPASWTAFWKTFN